MFDKPVVEMSIIKKGNHFAVPLIKSIIYSFTIFFETFSVPNCNSAM